LLPKYNASISGKTGVLAFFVFSPHRHIEHIETPKILLHLPDADIVVYHKSVAFGSISIDVGNPVFKPYFLKKP